MKKFLAITLICIFILSSFLFTACDERIDNNEQKSPEQSTAESQSNTIIEEKPMPVPAIKGKNAKQIFEDAISDYTNAKTFDVAMSMESTKNGEKKVEKIAYKINNSEMYLDIELEEQDMTIWFVENTVYLDMGDQKLKAVNTSIADVLGENFFNELLGELPTDISDMPEAYKKKMEDAQIYSYKGTYYFSVTLTDAEAIETNLGEKGFTETIYFDSTGALKKIVAKDTEETMTVLINSYGKDIKISKPENADEFVEAPTNQPNQPNENPNVPNQDGYGNQDPATYTVYEQLLDKIDNATSYIMSIEINGEPYIAYQRDNNGGKYVSVTESENSIYEMWIINGQGYVSINGETPLKTEITTYMRQSFENVENLKDYLIQRKVSGEDMIGLSIESTTIPGETLLTFSDANTNSTDLYSFAFGASYIDVLVTTTSNGQSESIKYIFDFGNLEVYPPI